MNKRILGLCLLLWVGAVSVCAGQARLPAKLAQPAAVRPYLMAQTGHSFDLFAAAYSPDGRFVLTNGDRCACLWDAATGKEIRQFIGYLSGEGYSAFFSPNGQYVLTSSSDEIIRLWETATGKEIRQFVGNPKSKLSYGTGFSPDGRLVRGLCDNTIIWWDVKTGKEMRRLLIHPKMVLPLVFSPDDKFLLIGSANHTMCLLSTKTGKAIRRFSGHSDRIFSAAFSPDGKFILTGSRDKTARLWSIATGKEVRQFAGHAEKISSVAFSSDGKFVLTGSGKSNHQVPTGNSTFNSRIEPGDNIVRLWETATGKEIRQFSEHLGRIVSVAFSPDGSHVLTASMDDILDIQLPYDHSARLWETATGKKVREFKRLSDDLEACAFSSNGRFIFTDSINDKDHKWDLATGRQVPQPTDSRRGRKDSNISPDGRVQLTQSKIAGKNRKEWPVYISEVATGKILGQLKGHNVYLFGTLFSPDSRFVMTGNNDGTAKMWEVATGNVVRQFRVHSENVHCVAFSYDSKLVLTGTYDGIARLWNIEIGKELRRFVCNSFVYSVAFSPDNRFILTGSIDSTTRIWDAATGKELCSLISFVDGGWAVVDPAGRYDASNPDKMDGLCWVVGNEPVDLSQLKERYYEPFLLAKIMGFNKDPIHPVEAFSHVKFYPAVTLKAPANGGSTLRIGLTNRGGGMGKVQVWVNGKEFTPDARPPHFAVDAPSAVLAVDLADAPGLKPGEPNLVRVTARNAEGYLESRGDTVTWTPSGKTDAAATPEMYAIVAGIGDYGSPALHLKLPPYDVAQMANALTLGAKRLFGADRVHLTLLSSDSTKPNALPPTKENFRKAFETLKKQAKPADILVVYLAGHGAALADNYYYLTSEARGFDLSDPDVRQACSVSDGELAAWTTAIAANKQVMILDTCAAGTAAHKLAEKRDIPTDQIRAIDRLKDRTGFYVLMGCAADAVSYEASQYGQGLLTYALLSGMQGERLREGEYVDVGLLFEYAADRVPQLAEGLNGIQRPQIMIPTTRNAVQGKQQAPFDIGRMTAAEKQGIVLSQPRPRILRFTLQSEDRIKDYLEIGPALRKCLREGSEGVGRGRDTPLYLDIEPEDLPGAVLLNGRYTVTGDIIKVDLLVSWNGRDAKLGVAGSRRDIPGLAAKLTAAIGRVLAAE